MNLNVYQKLVYIMFNFIYIISLNIFAYGISDRSYIKKRYVVIVSLIIMMVDTLIYFNFTDTYIFMGSGIVLMIIMLFLYSKDIIKNILMALFWILCATIGESLATYLASLVSDFKVSETLTNNLTYTVVNFLARFFMLVFAMVFCTIRKKDKFTKRTTAYWGIIIFAFAGSTFIVEAFFSTWYSEVSSDESFNLLIVVIILCIINILIYYLYDEQAKHYAMKSEIEQLKTHVDKQKIFYDNERRIYEKKENERRDMKEFLCKIRKYAEEKDYDMALNLIRSKRGSLNVRREIFSGSKDVDIILAYKISVAQEKGIAVSTDFNVGSTMEVLTEDIIVLLGNAMDNAIEASEKTENPYIKISINVEKGIAGIFIENSVNKAVPIKNGYIQTTKNESGHGWGIKSMRSIVNKYGGKFEIECDDHRFLLTIFMFV